MENNKKKRYVNSLHRGSGSKPMRVRFEYELVAAKMVSSAETIDYYNAPDILCEMDRKRKEDIRHERCGISTQIFV